MLSPFRNHSKSNTAAPPAAWTNKPNTKEVGH
jgi:hypothetical protein